MVFVASRTYKACHLLDDDRNSVCFTHILFVAVSNGQKHGKYISFAAFNVKCLVIKHFPKYNQAIFKFVFSLQYRN